ncbi:GlxA family transcriptional regulator [Pseudomonas batumici]|uniref:Transcriptional regulator, AraC family n=1 Tax=Pseudomonas batumici TaxID=226910 RepID=A0A0C2ETJ9_9PSED|nr:helix-turn-helix domain-containing protein [Pseudomonas batumici]KIH81878.1 Transcriptional regulator, AraC family [Pseudomonas batumici]
MDSVSAMHRPLRIGLLLYPGCIPAGLLAFADLLRAANRRAGQERFETVFVALQAGTVACAEGLSLLVSGSLAEADVDALLVAGFWAESSQQVEKVVGDNQALVSALSACSKQMQLWSYCTGVCLIAASGRLDGQASTVTWWLAGAMAQRYRKVNWQSERHCVINPLTATASGVNGYLPIAQALIERAIGEEMFHDLAKLMVLARPVQAHPAFAAMSLIEQSSPLLRQLHRCVEKSPAEQITVQRLAEQLSLSPRTLARKVSAETGMAVAAYARCIKLNQVSERLMLTSAAVNTISADLGFSSDSNLRRMFKELTDLTPLEYRQRFGRG